MRKLAPLGLILFLGACGGTSYGVSRDGVFPPRAPGAEYPNWEHMCKTVNEGSASDTLNEAGAEGFELVTLANQGGNDLMCFKRPKAPGK